MPKAIDVRPLHNCPSGTPIMFATRTDEYVVLKPSPTGPIRVISYGYIFLKKVGSFEVSLVESNIHVDVIKLPDEDEG